MKNFMSIIWITILISTVAVASEKSNSLILLTAKSQTETEEAIKRIEYFGGEVRHVFVPDVLIGYVPPQVDHQLTGVSFISDVIHEKINPASYYSVSKTNELATKPILIIDKEGCQHHYCVDKQEHLEPTSKEEVKMRTKNINIRLLCLLFLITVVCLKLIGCEKHDVSHEVIGYVEGTVIDSLTRLPIDSAWIRISPDTLIPPSTYTNSAGYYFLVTATGRHRVHYCGKIAYITKKTEEYKVNIDKTTRVNIELVPLKE